MRSTAYSACRDRRSHRFANPILYRVALIDGVFQDLSGDTNGDCEAGAAAWHACTEPEGKRDSEGLANS